MALMTEEAKAISKAELVERNAEQLKDDSKVIFIRGNDVNVEAKRYTRTFEQAEAFTAQFPKSYNVKAGRLYGPGVGDACGTNTLHVDLLPRKGNERNDSGIKRLKAFIKKAEALGYEVRWSKVENPNHSTMHSMEEVEKFVSPWLDAMQNSR